MHDVRYASGIEKSVCNKVKGSLALTLYHADFNRLFLLVAVEKNRAFLLVAMETSQVFLH